MAYRTSIDIDAPPERVWEVLIDVERWPEWTTSVTTVKRLETGMFRTGSNASIKQPKLREAIWRVVALTPQESFTWVARDRGVTTTARHVLKEREGGGAQALSHLQQTGPFAWFARLFFGRLTRRYMEIESQGLKIRCEAGRGPE